ncbi:MAG: DNA replication and repair protein RecF, partial [Alphaproteobacteria bacterium]|nr:DNA replication and repair protein RecF [Alphaproteobacteria bacterium]
ITTHLTKQCPAELCSTGEQKALLIAIMLAFARVLTSARQSIPILLLDDITAHLDETRREALFEEILDIGAQVWMSGTDTSSFRSFLKTAQHYQIEQGTISA